MPKFTGPYPYHTSFSSSSQVSPWSHHQAYRIQIVQSKCTLLVFRFQISIDGGFRFLHVDMIPTFRVTDIEQLPEEQCSKEEEQQI